MSFEPNEPDEPDNGYNEGINTLTERKPEVCMIDVAHSLALRA